MHVYLVNCGWTMLIIRSRTTKVGEGGIFHGGADDLIVTLFSLPATPASISRIWTFHIPTSSSSISCFFTEHTKPLFIADWSLPPPLPKGTSKLHSLQISGDFLTFTRVWPLDTIHNQSQELKITQQLTSLTRSSPGWILSI